MMRKDRTEDHIPAQGPLPLSITQIISNHRFASTIGAAHENGPLLFLAEHLSPLLHEFQSRHGSPTAAELDVLIAVAARAMMRSEGFH
jgi:hypothetical protein